MRSSFFPRWFHHRIASLALISSLSLLHGLSGCAESGGAAGKCTGSKCDLSTGEGNVDLSANDLKPLQDLTDPNAGGDFSEATDMTRLFVFGEACSDPLQCADNICVLSGVSGFCSKQCADKTECPSGFDCFAVLGGGIDPGLVINICVPETNLLCTPCQESTECSATGRDLCLPSVTGDKFCARDLLDGFVPIELRLQDDHGREQRLQAVHPEERRVRLQRRSQRHAVRVRHHDPARHRL